MSDLFGMEDGSVLTTHEESMCIGDHCCIHKPSDHPLRNAPLRWVNQLYTMYRRCPCGVLHPDPDHIRSVAIRFGAEHALRQLLHPCCPKNCCGDGSPSGRELE